MTRRWRTLRALVIADSPECVVCGTDENLTADHIIPISRGGAVLDIENLQVMCAFHNNQKNNRTLGQINDYVNRAWRDAI